MTTRALLEKAIRLAGSEAKLGKATGVSQHAIWKAKRFERVSAELARAIHHATGGEVGAHELRPDLWASREAVPAPAPTEGAPA